MKKPMKLVCCTLFLITACQGSSGDQDRSTVGKSLDPELYRAEIQALENDLFREPFDAGARSATAIKLDDLADKVAQTDGALPMLFAVEMRQLAAHAKAGRNADFVRGNWERIRAGTFDDAAWYRWRRAPERPQVASHVNIGSDPALKSEYANALEKLDELVRRGKRDVERLGEPEELTTTYHKGDYQDLVEDWEVWADRWNRKLERIEDDLPDKPEMMTDPGMRQAHDALVGAIRVLDSVPRGSGAWKTPFRHQWENNFRRAEKELDKARYQLEH